MWEKMEYREKLIITSLIDEHVFSEIDRISGGALLEKGLGHLNELTRLKKKIWD
jgi:hypothetical protein